MARPLWPIALSLSAAATTLGVSVRAIRKAVYRDGTLKAYAGPNRSTRILVSDLVAYVQTWPRATISRQLKKVK